MRRAALAALLASGITGCGGASVAPASGIAEPQPAPAAPQTCEQFRIAVENDVGSLVIEHASGCLVDADCILVNLGLPCLDACDTAVLEDDSVPFLDELRAYGAGACAVAHPACGPGPACAPVVPRCVNGGCHAVLAGT